MCQDWKDSFNQFLTDIGPKPRPELSLDRLDNDKNYEPGNCAWRTAKEQLLNRRPPKKFCSKNRYITINGVTRNISGWSKISGVSSSTLSKRFRKGVTGEALLLPPKH